eukprot:g1126.t1
MASRHGCWKAVAPQCGEAHLSAIGTQSDAPLFKLKSIFKDPNNYPPRPWGGKTCRADSGDPARLSGATLARSPMLDAHTSKTRAVFLWRGGPEQMKALAHYVTHLPTPPPEKGAELLTKPAGPRCLVVEMTSDAGGSAVPAQRISEQRRRAKGDEWLLRGIRSPRKGRIGELIWLKASAIICASVSKLASAAHLAEQQEDFESVEGFAEDLSGVIHLSQWYEFNTQRVRRLAGLRENFLRGAGDAGLERIGKMVLLAARRCDYINGPAHFGKAPKRKFSSSTGIEILAQKILCSEMVYILGIDIVPDLALCVIGRPMLQLSDSKNATTEPNEKNLKPDCSRCKNAADRIGRPFIVFLNSMHAARLPAVGDAPEIPQRLAGDSSGQLAGPDTARRPRHSKATKWDQRRPGLPQRAAAAVSAASQR